MKQRASVVHLSSSFQLKLNAHERQVDQRMHILKRKIAADRKNRRERATIVHREQLQICARSLSQFRSRHSDCLGGIRGRSTGCHEKDPPSMASEASSPGREPVCNAATP